MEEEMISTVSNIAEHSDSNSMISTNPPAARRRKRQRGENMPSSSSSPRYKGVVMQQNGHWGAQIYANHQRIWLGTFKTEKEAAMAYDSAAIKLPRGDSHRNLPWTEVTVQEPNFQELHSTEIILGMIKDGSYQSKFMDFIMRQCLNIGNNYNTAEGTNQQSRRRRNKQGIFYHELFHKDLTPSDVGKLNRLVIPKKQAMSCFPTIHGQVDHQDSGDNKVEAMHLTFFDNQYKPWSFRYCYWKSSQSYVFTKGWNGFVKEKDLKANDVITFYFCDYRDINSGEVQTFYMIETKSKNTEEVRDDNGYGLEEINPRGVVEEHGMIRREEVINKGFRLFGVNIAS
ncbi:AP2/ERF and B3 domain-containing transcription factor At1g50680-like [Macadamia integrifolia]|uniref:AP2/ERF and B3 domain-containing transcription factor At1g50680-like n=1 Tax=Macadamia integrifolia TaxID=60698 RepID=UPI001C4F160E|nr:AP2/ERF and B3 domain-containing transcription factor At1g50680-like [Macadamia integrifolia]